jgi:hypothetical protein
MPLAICHLSVIRKKIVLEITVEHARIRQNVLEIHPRKDEAISLDVLITTYKSKFKDQ